MTKVNKYQSWNVIPKLDEHSKIKHKIYREYIIAYIRTLMVKLFIPKLEFCLVDGFCGGGIYEDTNSSEPVYGSPVILLQAVQEGRILVNIESRKVREVIAHYYFIDKDINAIKSLKATIAELSKNNPFFQPDLPKMLIEQATFESKVDYLIASINQTKSGGKAIFFLDQYGYGNATITNMSKILKNIRKSEIVLTFNIESMYPFFSDKDEFKAGLRNLGLSDYIDWLQYERIKKTNDRIAIRQFIQRQISKAIKETTNAKFMTLFFIKPQSLKDWGYWLIHLSNEYKAHEVMKSIHWDNATYFGHELEHGIFEFGHETNKNDELIGNTRTLDFEFDFGQKSEQSCIEAVHKDFAHLIYQHEKVSVGELFQKTVSFTPATESHLQQAVKKLHEIKDIDVVTKDNKLRQPSKHYNYSDIITASKQIGLF